MGSSKYLSIEQAAKILGVHPKSIYRYARKGILTTICDGRHTLVLEESVLLHKKGRHDALSSPLNKDIIANLIARVQTLETKMSAVTRLLNLRHDPLNISFP